MMSNFQNNVRAVLMLLALTLSMPVVAQDFGYPSDKEFYKTHWNDVVADQGPDSMLELAQYVLFDFDKDGHAELYLWFTRGEEYLYAIRNNRVVRVNDTRQPVNNEYHLESFYPHFMAPCQLLLDQPVQEFVAMEQQSYDMMDVPRIWFGMHPVVEGTFGLKKAVEAIYCFDCHLLDDLLSALASGQHSPEYYEEYVMDTRNGYAMARLKTPHMNMVEMCYWNLANGAKLLAMHYHLSEEYDGQVTWFEQTLFMKYNPVTKRLDPVVAPIEGFDFMTEYNFSLPRKGLNINLIGAEDHELKWTGSGFRY